MRFSRVSSLLAGAALAIGLGAATFVQAAPQAAGQNPAAALAEDVTAILDPGGSPRLILVEEARGVSTSRTLAIGEEYRDGWKLVAATPDSATLERGGERVTTPILGRTAAAVEEATVQMAAGGLSNSCTTSADRKLAEDMLKASTSMLGGLDISSLIGPEVMAQMEAEIAAMSPEERQLTVRMNERMASGAFNTTVMMRASLTNLPSEENLAAQSRAAGVEPPPAEIMAMMRAMSAAMPPLSPQDQAAYDELSGMMAEANRLRTTRMAQRPGPAPTRVASCSPSSGRPG